MLWFSVILVNCLMALTACGSPKFYERHIEPAFDDKGMRRIGYATLNIEFLDAIDRDLKACYKEAGK